MIPFLKGRKTAEVAPLEAPPPNSSVCLPGMIRPAQSPVSGPSIEVVKEGDKIVRLIVKCSCGERLEVECLYSA
jgi:hypothetical protein